MSDNANKTDINYSPLCKDYQELLNRKSDYKFTTIHFENGVPSKDFDTVAKKITSHFNITEDYHFCCITNDVAKGFMIDYHTNSLNNRENKSSKNDPQLNASDGTSKKTVCENKALSG